MLLHTLATILPLASATNLFVASYAGTITSLSLTESNGNYSLTNVSVSTECAPNPSWLTIDANRGLLFCMNEGLATVNGSLSSFTINRNGSLTHIQNTTTISGPVSGIIYGEPAGQRAIALAHYGPTAAVSSFYLNGGGKFSYNQNITFTLAQPGPDSDRQATPHEHEAVLDPTGKYVLAPDLGADLVRVFSYDDELKLQELGSLKTAPGDGPRHVAFYNPYGVACENCTTFLYVVNELAASVTGYSVSYVPDDGGLEFEEAFSSPTYGNLSQPEGNAPSEILVSPDNRFLLIGNRNDSSLTVPNSDPSNSTQISSDTISTFALNLNGSLTFAQLAPAYGSYPRHFSTNAIGNLVAVGLQKSSEVVVLERDVSTGVLGKPVARIGVEGEITAVVFNEELSLGRLGI